MQNDRGAVRATQDDDDATSARPGRLLEICIQNLLTAQTNNDNITGIDGPGSEHGCDSGAWFGSRCVQPTGRGVDLPGRRDRRSRCNR
jgi:hypothetical protein